MKKLLLLDNYDSFTYNLYHLIKSVFPGEVDVLRDNQLNGFKLDKYDSLIISPGPGNPETTPWAIDLISQFYKTKPILGICLGMQCINNFFGGKTVKSDIPVHGKISKLIIKDFSNIYAEIPNGISVARYHSLMVNISDTLQVLATTENEIIMALKHQELEIYGLQYHPESFLCQYGSKMILNYMLSTGLI